MTYAMTTGYAAALKALRHLGTTATSAAGDATRLELDRADTVLAASATSPGANELRLLLTAIRRCHSHP
jgi:hypothetical protein